MVWNWKESSTYKKASVRERVKERNHMPAICFICGRKLDDNVWIGSAYNNHALKRGYSHKLLCDRCDTKENWKKEEWVF